ncbi:SET domain-containing protein-lysine N-methyltransferase [bacterium]|nr:SET domain-containing protein-lysine N-methyltransferase [bacterium]
MMPLIKYKKVSTPDYRSPFKSKLEKSHLINAFVKLTLDPLRGFLDYLGLKTDFESVTLKLIQKARTDLRKKETKAFQFPKLHNILFVLELAVRLRDVTNEPNSHKLIEYISNKPERLSDFFYLRTLTLGLVIIGKDEIFNEIKTKLTQVHPKVRADGYFSQIIKFEDQGRNLIHFAYILGQGHLVPYLRSQGVNLDATDNTGFKPVELAQLLGDLPRSETNDHVHVYDPVAGLKSVAYADFYPKESGITLSSSFQYMIGARLAYGTSPLHKYLSFREANPIFFSENSDSVVILRNLPRIGDGVFARINMPKNHVIVIYGGEVGYDADAYQTNLQSKYMSASVDLTLNIENKIQFFQAEIKRGIGALINHSKTPNCIFGVHVIGGFPRLYIVTKNLVNAGDQLTVDYGSAYIHDGATKELTHLPGSLYDIGNWHANQGDVSTAINVYSRAIEAAATYGTPHEELANYYGTRANCYARLSQPNLALEDIKTALTHHPKNQIAIDLKRLLESPHSESEVTPPTAVDSLSDTRPAPLAKPELSDREMLLFFLLALTIAGVISYAANRLIRFQ